VELSTLPISKNYRLITYDIKELFVNIRINGVIYLMRNTFGCPSQNQQQPKMIKLTEILLAQNCFTFQNKIYNTKEGIAMGSPISNTTA
jgi:hypothetical protein